MIGAVMCNTEMRLPYTSSSLEESQLQNPLQRAQNLTDTLQVFALHLVVAPLLSVFENQSISHHTPLFNPPGSLTNFCSAKKNYWLIGQHEQPLLETIGFSLPGFSWGPCISSKGAPSSAIM